MQILNIEIKARCRDPEKVKRTLQDLNARVIGTDHQRDTYFKVPNGRLKLREGNIMKKALLKLQSTNMMATKLLTNL